MLEKIVQLVLEAGGKSRDVQTETRLFSQFSHTNHNCMQTQSRNQVCSTRNMLVALWLTVLIVAVPLHSQPRGVMAVKHFNSDGIADTLVGTRSAGGCFLPHSIRWGDTGSLTVAQTTFSYPSWIDLSGSGFTSAINADTLQDIVFFIQGRVGSPFHDTSRVFIIGGGSSLHLQSNVAVASLPASQSSPYYSLDLFDGSGFTEGKVVDPTGHKSWRFSLSFPPQPIITDVRELRGWTVRLYPNPTTGAETQLAGQNVPAGRYTVSVHSVQGSTLLEQVIEVDGSGEFLRVLDLHSLVSGSYTVRLAGVHPADVFTYSLVLIR